MDVSCSIVLSLLDLASRSWCIHDCSAPEALLPSADMAGSWCSVSACQWDLHMEDTNALSCIQVERLMTAIPCTRMKEGCSSSYIFCEHIALASKMTSPVLKLFAHSWIMSREQLCQLCVVPVRCIAYWWLHTFLCSISHCISSVA